MNGPMLALSIRSQLLQRKSLRRFYVQAYPLKVILVTVTIRLQRQLLGLKYHLLILKII